MQTDEAFEAAHRLYERYVQAARLYFEKPTAEHWDRKEEAFEQYTQCIQKLQNNHQSSSNAE